MHLTAKSKFMLSLCLCLLLTMMVGMAHAAEKLKVGAIYPLSGGVAQAASYAVDGVKMAVEDINAKGGVQIGPNKSKVELFLYDSKCNPTPAVAAIQKMISRDKVVVISGDYCSSCTLAEREVSGRNEIVQLTPVSVNPKITSPGYPYMFRLCMTIDMYAEPFVEYVVKKRPDIKKVALLAITDDYGRSAVEIYTKLFTKGGITITGTEFFKHGDTDFYTQITKLLSKKFDAIYIVTDEDAQNIGILKQLKELGYKGTIFGCSTYTTQNMIKLGGKELLNGLYVEGPTFELYKNEPEIKAWLNRYEKTYGRKGNAFSLWGYQSIIILADAVSRAGSMTDKAKIQKAMAATDLTKVLGYYGKPKFSENGQAFPSLGVVQWKDGELVPVYRQAD